MKLFDTKEPVPLFCDTYKPAVEKRRGEEVKVIDIRLLVQPLTPELAAAFASGEYPIKSELFNASDGEMRPNVNLVGFDVAIPRQTLKIFATPETVVHSATIAQAKIEKIKARVERGVNAWGLVLHAKFGPVDKSDLEFVHRWKGTQMWALTEESEPMLDEDVDEELLTDADEKAREVVGATGPLPPPPKWDDDDQPEKLTPVEEAAQELGHRYPKATKKGKKR